MKHNRRKNGGERSQVTRIPRKPAEAKALPFIERISCTVQEACEATGLGRTKLYALIGTGQLQTTTIGRRRLVMVHSLLSLLQTNKST
jgi:excisionase family DNA binding protein